MILYKDEELKIEIKYIYKSQSKNFIFYKCNQRPVCKGRGKININSKEFLITEKSNKNILHNKISYEDFIKYLEKNYIKNIDFTQKYIQKYYVYKTIKNNNNIQNPDLKKKYYSKFKANLNLSLSALSIIRSRIINKYKNLELLSLINKIEITEFKSLCYGYKI